MGCWARSSAGWARCGATALEKAAASVSRDGDTHGSACVQQWGKDRMRAAVRKEMSLSFFSFWRNRAKGGAEQNYLARSLHRPGMGRPDRFVLTDVLTRALSQKIWFLN